MSVGSVVTGIEVNVAGIGEVEGLADALKEAASQAAKLQESLRGGLGIDGIGKTSGALDEMVRSMQAAAKELKDTFAQVGKASAGAVADIKAAADEARSLADSNKLIAGSAKSAADAEKILGDSAASAAKPLTSAADSGKALADASRGIADSSPQASAGIKGVGAAAADQAKLTRDAGFSMKEYQALMKESADTSARTASIMAGSQVSMARVRKDVASVQVAAAREASRAQVAADAETSASARTAHNVILGLAGATAYGIWQAAKLQTQVTRLYTSAGEQQKNLPMIQAGILGMAGPEATSQADLASGAYWAESAGFHGKYALNVLQGVAQGAYAEGAPLSDVANAATSILDDLGMRKPSQKQVNSVINQMLAAVGSGKMTMAGLSTAIPAVLPVAQTAGLSLPQVLGSLATMTQSGMTPENASQNLGHTISKLLNPTAVQTAELYQLGLDPVQMEQQLGKRGISGTLGEIQSAIKAHEVKSGPDAGMVRLPAMNLSKAAQQDALIMMKQMPPAIRATAEEYWKGTISAKAWNKEMFSGSESGRMKNLLQEFGTVTNAAHGFNSALKSGQPDVQAYSSAVAHALGDSVSAGTFLKLEGGNAKTAAQNIGAVAAAAKDAGTNIAGWKQIQSTFDYQRKSFQYSAEAAATSVGSALLPYATDAMSGLAKAGSFLAGHKTLSVDLAIAGGTLGLIEAGKKLASPLETALGGVGKIAKALDIPGLDKLAGIGKGGGASAASGGLDKVAGAATTAAGALDKLAGAAETGGIPGVGVTRKGEKTAGHETEKTLEKTAVESGAPGFVSRVTRATGQFLFKAAMVPVIAKTIDSIFEDPNHEGTLAGTNPRSWWNSNPEHLLNWNKQHVNALPGTNPHSWFNDNPANFVKDLFGGTPTENHGQLPGAGSRFGPVFGYTTAPLPPAAAPQVGYNSPAFRAGLDAMTPPHLNVGKVLPVQVKFQVQGDAGADLKSKLASITNLTAPKISMTGVTSSVSAGMNQAAAEARNGGARIVTAISSQSGAMAAAGTQLDAGLAAGINAGKGAAVGAAQQVASEVAAVMRRTLQISSPSKVGISIGASTVEGIVIGLLGGQSAIDAAATALGKSTAKPADIAAIIKSTTSIVSEISQAVSKGEIPKYEGTALTRMLSKDETKLEALANRRAALEAEITNAGQVTQSAIDSSSILNASSIVQNGPSAAQSPDEIISGMQQQAQAAKQFSAELARLAKAGLNATTLSQIAQAGPQAGLATAQGIDAGGRAAIKSINQSEAQIIKAAQQMGDTAGPAMYQSGQDIGKGVASGLKNELSDVDKQMQALAKQMAQALKTALGGTGAGSAGYAAGQAIGQGIAAGIAGSASAIQGAIAGAVAGTSKSKGKDASHPAAAYYGGGFAAAPPPAPAGAGYSSQAQAPVQHITHVHVYGSVTSDGDLATKLQGIYLERQTSNMSSGLVLPGRRA